MAGENDLQMFINQQAVADVQDANHDVDACIRLFSTLRKNPALRVKNLNRAMVEQCAVKIKHDLENFFELWKESPKTYKSKEEAFVAMQEHRDTLVGAMEVIMAGLQPQYFVSSLKGHNSRFSIN